MSETNTTKSAFAAAMKELMETLPFAQISVTALCAQCGMNRKSFYYHFKDKYDLVNWIYDTEFASFAGEQGFSGEWELLEAVCAYFYANRAFYRRAWQIEGQNCFAGHFRECLLAAAEERLAPLCPEREVRRVQAMFFADAICCAIGRWMTQREPAPPQYFLAVLRSCAQVAGAREEAAGRCARPAERALAPAVRAEK